MPSIVPGTVLLKIEYYPGGLISSACIPLEYSRLKENNVFITNTHSSKITNLARLLLY